ncbi:MAG: helix-turn-helix transcriptional regulator [Butyrivibrio sp.]|nr:helix-turn-helix transcriptional regulator [Butyrivibrio sp.]
MELSVDNKEVIKRISKCLKARHLTQEKLAKMIGIDNSVISKIKKGNRSIPDETLDAMADVFGVDPFELKYGVVIRSNISSETIDSLIIKKIEEMCIKIPNVAGCFKFIHVNE